MAPQTNSVALLRAASFRLSSASKPELPHIAAIVAQDLLSCKDVLSNPDLANQKDSDAAIALHRFNTQITALLQDRTLEGRWAAIVLIKAAIEAGGWETLRKSIGWVRGLLTLLKKPDPPLTRCLCILTLTRIFMLTWDYPTLIREITTPNLPTFVSTCLNNVSSRGIAPQETKAALESFAQLLPRHPTIFRVNQDAISKLLTSVFETKSSGDHMTDLAARVSVLLHQCEPKGGASEKWQMSLDATIQGAHAMADRTFMSVDEDWQSVTGKPINKSALNELYSKAKDARKPEDGPVAQFITAGHQGLMNHLRLLASYFAHATSGPVVGFVGAVTDLLTRLMAITISGNTSRSTIRFNREVTREERDALTVALPRIHIASMEVLSTLLDRYGNAMTSTLTPLLDQIIWIFHASSNDLDIRTATYTLGNKLLSLNGQSLQKQHISSLRKYITACCEDLLPTTDSTMKSQQPANGNKQQTTMNADTFLKQSAATPAAKTQLAGLKSAAWNLLPTLMGQLPIEQCPIAIRATMERTAVLTNHKDAILASTLNHTSSGSSGRKSNSLLPLLARSNPLDPAVEVLLRPRMPIIQIGRVPRPSSNEEDQEAMDQDSDSDSNASSDNNDNDDSISSDSETQMHEPQSRQIHTIMQQPTSSNPAEAGSAVSSLPKEASTNWALNKTPGIQGPSAFLAAQETAITRLPSPSTQPSEESRTIEERGGKRRREEGQVSESMPEKRVRPSVEAEERPRAAPAQVEEDSDDDDDGEFIVPEIVMGGDSEDEDEEDDE